MRLYCPHSLRWHQQFCHSLSRTQHQHCFPAFQTPVRYYRQPPRGRKTPTGPPAQLQRKNGLVVREYEQAGPGKGGLARAIPWGLQKEADMQTAFLQSKIRELEKELDEMKQDPFEPDIELMKSLPVDTREELLKELEAEGLLQEDDWFDEEELDAMMAQENLQHVEPVTRASLAPSVTLRIPNKQKIYVKRFNDAIQKLNETPRVEDAPVTLWKWYLRCQQHVMAFSNIVSEDVWQILWKSQSGHFYRPKHVAMLANDMITAGVKLTGPQWMAYIRALQANQNLAAAVAAWEGCRASMGSDTELLGEFYSLGVNLYSELGRPHKAQELVSECLETGANVTADLYIPLILAWARSQDLSAAGNAWLCYLNLRDGLGNRITAETFAILSNKLLALDRRDMALAVFKDLMISLTPGADDSVTLFANLVQSTGVSQSSISAEHIDQSALKALLAFPKKLNNKYFFGAWIKQLIGKGNVDGAADVVELMYERGVRLDAKHLNGLIGAWLRQGNKAAQQNAERYAWAMVQARIQMVKRRESKQWEIDQPAAGSVESELYPAASKQDEQIRPNIRTPPIPHFLRRSAPPATIETFSILLRHYTIRSDFESAEYLTSLMEGPAQMRPNSYIMNHWLFASLRKGDLDDVWNKYIALTKISDSDSGGEVIKPDLETYVALWDAAKVCYDPARAARSTRSMFPDVRPLFREMKEWFDDLAPPAGDAARQDFTTDIYEVIIRCLCLRQDLPGVLVAVWGLRQMFDAVPGVEVGRMVCFTVAKALTAQQVSGRGGGKNRAKRLETERRNLVKVAELMEGIEEAARMDWAVKSGLSFDEVQAGKALGEEVEKSVRVEVLRQFLIEFVGRFADREGRSGEDWVREATGEMGVDGTGLMMIMGNQPVSSADGGAR